jgi:hypothetical protein
MPTKMTVLETILPYGPWARSRKRVESLAVDLVSRRRPIWGWSRPYSAALGEIRLML